MNANAHLLSVNNIEVVYDHVILVLKGVSLQVAEGGIVALLGANGAGKTTTLKAISNLLGTERGEVTKGSIDYQGGQVDALNPSELVKRGVIQVMEGRHCFEHLTVEENLLEIRLNGFSILQGIIPNSEVAGVRDSVVSAQARHDAKSKADLNAIRSRGHRIGVKGVGNMLQAVSYTHLTLPTILLV